MPLVERSTGGVLRAKGKVWAECPCRPLSLMRPSAHLAGVMAWGGPAETPNGCWGADAKFLFGLTITTSWALRAAAGPGCSAAPDPWHHFRRRTRPWPPSSRTLQYQVRHCRTLRRTQPGASEEAPDLQLPHPPFPIVLGLGRAEGLFQANSTQLQAGNIRCIKEARSGKAALIL